MVSVLLLFSQYVLLTTELCLPSSGPPTLHKLLEDLQEVLEWYELGIYLDIPEASLEEIKSDENGKVRACRREMLSTWLRRNPQPTWATIVTALTGIARVNLAVKIALKYGMNAELIWFLSSYKPAMLPLLSPFFQRCPSAPFKGKTASSCATEGNSK